MQLWYLTVTLAATLTLLACNEHYGRAALYQSDPYADNFPGGIFTYLLTHPKTLTGLQRFALSSKCTLSIVISIQFDSHEADCLLSSATNTPPILT